MNKLAFVLLGCLLTTAPALANPLITFPPGNSACSIKVSFHDNQMPAPEKPGEEPDPTLIPRVPKSADIEKVNDLLTMTIKRLNGASTIAWFPGKLNLVFFRDSDVKQLNSSRFLNVLPPVFYLNYNESWYGWIGADSLKDDKAVYNGIPCKLYRKSVTIPPFDPAFPPGIATYQIWIAAETNVPLAFDDGSARYDLAFKAPSLASSVLPDEVQQEILRYEDLLQSAKPSR